MKEYEESKMNEIWKDIPGYEGLYQVSNLGRVKSLYNYRGGNSIMIPKVKNNYYQIGLRKNKVRKWKAVHRLVATAFIVNENNLPCVNHIDENKLNNRVENLEWCTTLYNNTYGTRISKVVDKTGKRVFQYDLKGNFIKEYPSLADAARKVKLKSVSSICKCCRGKSETAKGYKWKYKSEVMLNANGI